MANQPRPGNPARAIRVEDGLWNAARTKAAENGESVSEVVRKCLEQYVERPSLAEQIVTLHPPTLADDGETRICATCVSLGEHDKYPCPTLLALTQAGSA